jgi:hypothetical protein
MKLETRIGNQEIHTQYLLATVKDLKRALEGGKPQTGSKYDRWCAQVRNAAPKAYERDAE